MCVCVGDCVYVRLVSFMWLFEQKVNRKEKTRAMINNSSS